MNKKIFIWILAIFLLSSFVYASDINTDLKAYYKEDTTSFIDYLNLNNGTITGATFTNDGKINNAYNFESNDYITINTDLINSTTDFSHGLWVRYNGTKDTSYLTGSINPPVFSTGWFFLVTKTGKVGFYAEQTGGSSPYDVTLESPDGYLSPNKWYYLMVTRNSSTWTLYVNNTYVNDVYSSTNIPNKGVTYVGGALGGTRFINGTIDEIGFWNYRVSEADRDVIYNSYLGNQPPFSSNFSIVSTNYFDDSIILTFNATINGTTYNTTTGTLITPYLVNHSSLLNITIESEDFFPTTYLNYNVSSTLQAIQWQTELYINATRKIDNAEINNSLFTASGLSNATILKLDGGNYTITFSKADYFNKQQNINLPIGTNTSTTIANVSNAQINIFAKNINSGAVINQFSINVNETTFSEYQQTINSSLSFKLIRNQTFTYFFNASGYVNQTGTFLLDNLTKSLILFVTANGDMPVFIVSTNDSQPITQRVDLVITSATAQQIYNFTGGNTTITGLTQGTEYQIDLTSLGFNPASYTLTYNQTTAQGVTFLMTQNGINVTFIIQDSLGNLLEDALISIRTFVNGSLQYIGSKNTNILGEATFVLIPNSIHEVSISKDGYIPQVFSIDVTSEEYGIILELFSDFEFIGDLTGLSYTYNPKNTTINIGVINFQFITSATGNDLEFSRIRIYNGTQIIASAISSVSAGDEVNLLYNTTNWENQTLVVDYCLKKIDRSVYCQKVFYKVETLNLIFSGSGETAREWAKENLDLVYKLILFGVIIIILAGIFYIAKLEPSLNSILTIILSFISAYYLGFGEFELSILAIVYVILVYAIISRNQGGFS